MRDLVASIESDHSETQALRGSVAALTAEVAALTAEVRALRERVWDSEAVTVRPKRVRRGLVAALRGWRESRAAETADRILPGASATDIDT